ncbi:hypothetical protein LSCM1_01499 [Leishmania martiniquensis]|uniref:Uncharacterized protein n=1 Tax=Leishmania martiniquensis TaxID=1580590 RepID=A0A836KMP5_9TRYP|nr:hypothetical protein LSCM1_01499 [Leishmania martiniquensis]
MSLLTPIGSVIGIAGVIAIALVIIWCNRRARRELSARSRQVYVEEGSVNLQEEGAFASTRRGPGDAGRSGNRAANGNGRRSAQNLRDNYADRDAIDYRTEGDNIYRGLGPRVRPASPNAERVEGIPIEARVRPRRNLPRARVVVQYGDQDVCLDFRGVERVPQAGPPPLTLEEKQRLEDERHRVASPEFYGRAEYEERRASNTNTPNVLLSSSLLQELQRQYGAASASGPAFANHASESSVGSMSFRPGSPAGSARRVRHSRQSATPASVSLQNGSIGGLQFLRRHKNSATLNDAGTRASPNQLQSQLHSLSSPQRNRHDDLESTSDDFEDASLHNDLFHTHREQLREFLLKQEQLTQCRLSPITGLGSTNGFDQISLHGTSPPLLDRQASAEGPMASSGPVGLGGEQAAAASVASAYSQSLTPHRPYHPPVVTGLSPANASFESRQSWQSTSANSPVEGLARVSPYPHTDPLLSLSGSHPAAEGEGLGGGAHTGGQPPYLVLPKRAATNAHYQTLLPVAAQVSCGSTATCAPNVETLSTPLIRWNSSLRSPFSLPGNDPVTATYSASSRSVAQSSKLASPLERGGTDAGRELSRRADGKCGEAE